MFILAPMKLFDFENNWFDEKTILERLLLQDSSSIISFFLNVIREPVSQELFQEYEGVYLTLNTQRSDLKLSREGRPGDIDILMIPFSKREIFFDRTAVLEVKVVRPTRANPRKNSDSLGRTQVYGLIEDGFPIVGLFHICMPEPLLESGLKETLLGSLGIDTDNPDSYFDMSDEANFERIKIDPFPWFSAETQIKRMISEGFPKYIGIEAIGVSMDKGGKLVLTGVEFYGFKGAYFNPKKKQETQQKIKAHFEANSEFYKRIPLKIS
jgi:hypothetical protein